MPRPILGSYSGEWLTLTTPEQARLLSDPAAVRHLHPFIGRTLSVSEAAREIGVSTERMMYRVRQFLRAGLLQQVGERQRPGRPVRLYRAPGGLRVPFALTPFEDLEAQLRTQTAPYERLRHRGLARGLRRLEHQARLIYRADSGEIHSETELQLPNWRSDHIGGDYVGVQWLTDAEARHIQRLMDDLRESLSEPEEKAGRRPYLLQAALVELNPDDPAEVLGPPR